MAFNPVAWLSAHATAVGCVRGAMAAPPWTVPLLQALITFCSFYIGLVYLDRLWLVILLLLSKRPGRRAEKLYKFHPLKKEDASAFPRVLVQLPMYNEKEVYKISIGAACGLAWPRDRLLIQVLDDSTDNATKELIRKECEAWRGRGVNIKRVTRTGRAGYKAGNLAHGLAESDAQECEFVALFDADFQPPSDFLERTVPFLVLNRELGSVITNWSFRNETAGLLTRFQVIFFANYFGLLDPVGSAFFGYANFFGSGGLWRMAAIQDAGGWKSRVLVEDVDLSISVLLKGWKSVYLDDLHSVAELADSYKGFRLQCNRLANGVMNLYKIHIRDILNSKVLDPASKYFLAVSFFNFMIYEHIAGVLLSFVACPVLLHFPEIQASKLILLAPFLVQTLKIAITTPRFVHLSVFWVLFENVRGFVRAKDSAIAYFGFTTEWVVTEKGGDGQKPKRQSRPATMFIPELLVGLYLFICAALAPPSRAYSPLRLYLYFQALAYFLCGLDVKV